MFYRIFLLDTQGVSQRGLKYIIIIIIIILACYWLGGGLLVSPDLNKRSKLFTPALYECCVQFALMWSSLVLWPKGDLGATESSDLIPS